MVGNGVTPVVHDQGITMTELRLGAQLALSERWGVSLSLPLKVFATSIRYVDLFGDEVQLTAENIHHRNQTLTGLGDPWLLGTWRTGTGSEASAWSFGARAGVSLPLGKTEADPFVLGDLGRAHEHFQFGTGTVDPVVGVDAVRRVGAFQLGGWALTKQTLYANGKGYQAGDRYAAGLFAQSALGLGAAWSFRLGTEAQAETPERWSGAVPKDDGNQGRVDVLVAGGARWSRGAFSLEAIVRVPVVTHVVGGQIDIPVLFELGASWSFDAWGGGDVHEDEHGEQDEHDHGADDHDHGGGEVVAIEAPDLDILEFVKDGSAPDLVPIPGKITIFDFWAPWCKPCKQLSSDLRELARRYPGKFAVRLVNVVDWDSPAALRWLTPGKYNLPHLKIYNQAGQLVYERSTSPPALIVDVEALLAP